MPRQVFSPSRMPFDCMSAVRSLDAPGIYLCGIPYDGSASFRKGARHAPDEIRLTSYQTETYSPYFDRDLSQMTLFDLGNAKIGKNQREGYEHFACFFEGSLDDDHRLITLGGDHSISIAPIWAHHQANSDLVVIQLDAHADLRDSYEDNPHSHASIMARVEELGIETHQYGIRSGTSQEFSHMKKNGTRCEKLEDLLERIDRIEAPIYLTLDLDFFDPSELPGTGTPEAGGESFQNFIKILRSLKSKDFVGADINELAPPIDKSGNSTIYATKVVREVIMAVNK